MFSEALQRNIENKRVIVSSQLLWRLCRTGSTLQRIKDIVMSHYLLKRDVNAALELMKDESATATIHDEVYGVLNPYLLLCSIQILPIKIVYYTYDLYLSFCMFFFHVSLHADL